MTEDALKAKKAAKWEHIKRLEAQERDILNERKELKEDLTARLRSVRKQKQELLNADDNQYEWF